MERNENKSLLKNVLRKVLYSTGFLCGKVANIKHIRDIEDWESIPSVAKVDGYKPEEIYKGLIGFTFAVEQSIDGIAIGDLESKLTYVNDAFAQMHGYSPEEMIGMKVANIHNKEQMDEYNRGMKQIKTQGSWIGEIGHIRKDGTPFPTYVSVTLLKDPGGETTGILLVCRDITERKKAEEKLLEYQGQLKSLASQLTLAEERERHRIATELHDRISQSLVISKMNLEALRKSGHGQEFGRTLDEVCNLLGQTIVDTRTLTFDLSSPILYELGFEAAVAEWLTDQIEDKYGIASEFEDDGRPKLLGDDIGVLLFRNVRELLINVVKHAHAHKVKVAIRKVGKKIQVSVEDVGVGFDPAKAASTTAKRTEFGLFSIRQSLEELGGRLDIESEPSRGCKVTMTAPLKQE